MTEENDGVETPENTPDPAIVAIEGRARRMGWRPKDEFRGDPGRWTDAATFIERGETELPVLRERYRALDDRFASLERRAGETEKELKARLKDVTSTLKEFREFANRGEERAFARAKAELEARMAAAVSTADANAYNAAATELRQLDNDRERARVTETTKPPAEPEKDDKPPQVDPPKIHPDAQAWVTENTWFNLDPVMTNYAVAVHQNLLRERPGLSMRDNLAEVKADIMRRFPEKFDNPRRTQAAAVSAPTGGTVPPKKPKGKYPDFNDWPADAKAAYNKFKSMMPNYTHDEYAKLYFAGEE